MLPARAIAQRIYRAGGIRRLYRGLSVTNLRARVWAVLFRGATCCSLLLPPPSHTHITSHTPKVRRHAAPLRAVQSRAPRRPSAGTERSGRRARARTHVRAHRPLLAGGAAGIIGWLGTFPFDVIKTRMQAYGISTGTGSSAGEGTLWRAARELYAEAGGGGSGGRMGVFWRGFVPTIVRAVPVNMAVFGTFEGVVWAFSR